MQCKVTADDVTIINDEAGIDRIAKSQVALHRRFRIDSDIEKAKP